MPIQLQDRVPYSDRQIEALAKALSRPGESSLWVDSQTGMLRVRFHGEALKNLEQSENEESVD